MIAEQHYADLLRSWDPDGDDLPEEVALHLDSCASCAAIFHERFARWESQTPVVAPAGTLERVLPPAQPANRGVWTAGGALLAAAVALGIVIVPASMMMVGLDGGSGATGVSGEEREATAPPDRASKKKKKKKAAEEEEGDTAEPSAAPPPPPPPPRRSSGGPSGDPTVPPTKPDPPTKKASSGGGGGGGAPRAASGAPGSIKVTVSGQDFLAIEVKCPDGTRKRAAFSGATATAQGIPSGMDCEVLFKGGLPAKYRPVKSGRAYTCSFKGSKAECK